MILEKYKNFMGRRFRKTKTSNRKKRPKKEYTDTKRALVKKLYSLLDNHSDLKSFRYFNSTRCELLDTIFKDYN